MYLITVPYHQESEPRQGTTKTAARWGTDCGCGVRQVHWRLDGRDSRIYLWPASLGRAWVGSQIARPPCTLTAPLLNTNYMYTQLLVHAETL